MSKVLVIAPEAGRPPALNAPIILHAKGPVIHQGLELLHLHGAKSPESVVCLRDIIGMRLNLYALNTVLANLYERFRGNKAPFPESAETAEPPPTLQSIASQIRRQHGIEFVASRSRRRDSFGRGR